MKKFSVKFSVVLIKCIIFSLYKRTYNANIAQGLKSVQETLMYGKGYLPFDEAYHIYSSFFVCDPDKQAFRDKLLEPVHGLNICIVTQPGISGTSFIVLKGSSKMEEFLVDFIFALEEQGAKSEILDLDYDTVNLLLKSIDTEYDKNVLRTILALSHTRPELYNLGINPASAKQHICEITEAARECKNALIAG